MLQAVFLFVGDNKESVSCSSKCAVGLSYLCLSFSLPHQKGVGQRTPTCLFFSLWTASSSMKTNCVADRRNSEFWQRIGQPYARNLGRCFVACPPSMSTTATKHFPGSRTRPITQSFHENKAKIVPFKVLWYNDCVFVDFGMVKIKR